MKLVVAALLCIGSFARADATVHGTIAVNRPKEVPASAVLVYIVGFAEPPAQNPIEVKQAGKRFLPDLIAVTAGGTVSFPNGDPFLHNVFSSTSDRTFDLGSFPRGETRTRTFPRRGVIDVYCNIHPEMSATLVVLPNTRFAFVGADGQFQIDHVPPGTWTLFAFSRRAVRPVSTQITVGASGTVETTLQLDEAQRDFSHPNKFGEQYRPTTVYAPGA